MKANRIPLIAREQKKLYTWFLVIAVLLFAAATVFTQFNPLSLLANGEAFWSFLTEDFSRRPCLPVKKSPAFFPAWQ